MPNPLPQNGAPPIQEQEFLTSFDANGDAVNSVPISQGVMAGITSLATGTPDGNYVAAANPETVGNSPTLLPLNVEKFSSSGSTMWTATLPTTSQYIQFRPSAIIANASGDIYVAGSVNSLTAGMWGIFFAKFDGNSGTLVWQDEFPSTSERFVSNIATDPNGNLYVTGTGNANLTSPSKSAGLSSFLAKLDSNTGETIWSVAAPSGISFTGVAVNSSSNGYIIGEFGTPLPIAYVAGFSPQSGALTWQEQYGNGTLRASNISIDAAGNAIFVGGISAVSLATNNTAPDLFVAKAAANGEPIWMQEFGAGREQGAADSVSGTPPPYVVTDDQSNIYVAGITSGAFPGFQNPSGLGETFVAKFTNQ